MAFITGQQATISMTGASWPPSWFGSITTDQTDTAERTEEILAAEFGRLEDRPAETEATP